ncbi:MAG: 6-pyruvoyl tetrahydropterin synthase family protein [Alphaproteobacteria bacterium GM7ARS4]|nr:6-pyruvoyl tetrahydropterin synthase family protein [Alphaproteobacteria bacterium GM7ARS4]
MPTSSVEIYHRFSFVAARAMTHMPPDHVCSRLHGHSFKIEVRLKGPINEQEGWLIDHSDIAHVVNPLIEKLDHRYLNEIDGLDKPSNENIARWFWRHCQPHLPLLTSITVIDTDETGCLYDGT